MSYDGYSVVNPPFGRVYKNWAANSNGQVMPMIKDQPDDVSLFVFPRKHMRKRRHNWIDLERDMNLLEISVELTPITYAIYVNGQTERARTVEFRPVVEVPERWDHEKSAGFVYRTRPHLGEYQFKDFVMAEIAHPEETSQYTLQDMSKSQLSETYLDQAGLDAKALEEEL